MFTEADVDLKSGFSDDDKNSSDFRLNVKFFESFSDAEAFLCFGFVTPFSGMVFVFSLRCREFFR